MTPAQRKYDLELVASMHKMAQWIEPRSRKVSDTLRVAADRIYALASSLPADPAVQLDEHGNNVQPQVKQPRPHAQPIKIQPASTPAQPPKA
jgi:hypothetical protein